MQLTQTNPEEISAGSVDGLESDSSGADLENFGGEVKSRFSFGGTSKRSLLIAFRQLSLLVETGIDIAEALELVSETCKSERLSDCFEDIFEDINRGSSLSNAVKAQSEILGPEISASIQAGEASGKLVEVLRQVADRLEEELSIQSQIRGALAYPTVLLSASVAVAITLVWFVLPQFEESFVSMGVNPPTITKILLTSAAFIRENVLLVGAGIGLIVGAAAMTFVNRSARIAMNNIAFASPFLGAPIRHLEVGRLFVNLGHLLGNGVSLLEALELVKSSTTYGHISALTEAWESDIVEGKGLSNRLGEFNFLPEGAEAMLIMAERTGKLEKVLSTAGSYYQEEGSLKLKSILKLSEPIIIVFLGVFVGTVVASVLLPILDVQSSAGA